MKYSDTDMAILLCRYYKAKPKNYGFNNYMYMTYRDQGKGYARLSLRVPPPSNAPESVYQIWEAEIRSYTFADLLEMKVIQDDYNPEGANQDWQKFPDFISALDAADKLRCQFIKDYYLHHENKETLDAIEALP